MTHHSDHINELVLYSVRPNGAVCTYPIVNPSPMHIDMDQHIDDNTLAAITGMALCRMPELEKRYLDHPHLALWYALIHMDGTWPAAERIIKDRITDKIVAMLKGDVVDTCALEDDLSLFLRFYYRDSINIAHLRVNEAFRITENGFSIHSDNVRTSTQIMQCDNAISILNDFRLNTVADFVFKHMGWACVTRDMMRYIDELKLRISDNDTPDEFYYGGMHEQCDDYATQLIKETKVVTELAAGRRVWWDIVRDSHGCIDYYFGGEDIIVNKLKQHIAERKKGYYYALNQSG